MCRLGWGKAPFFIHMGKLVPGDSFFLRGLLITMQARCFDRRFSPGKVPSSCWGHVALVWFRRWSTHSFPPPFLVCSDKGLLWILEKNSILFSCFFQQGWGYSMYFKWKPHDPINIYNRPSSRIMFFYRWRKSLSICVQTVESSWELSFNGDLNSIFSLNVS